MWYIYLPTKGAFLFRIRYLYNGQQAQKLQTTIIITTRPMPTPRPTPKAMLDLHHKHNILEWQWPEIPLLQCLIIRRNLNWIL